MDNKHNVNGRRFFFGFVLLAIGIVMILERAGILSWEIYDFLLSWKMLLVAIGAYVFFSGNKGVGIVVMGLGAFFMLPDIFDNYDQVKRFFWPSVLLLVGLSFMLGDRKQKIRQHVKFSGKNAEVNNNLFDEFVVFGGREINMVTPNLLGGRSTVVFGSVEIDLRQCNISTQGCTIDLAIMFGSNVIKVPNDWTVLNKVTTIFGGYSDLRIKDPLYSPNPSKTIVLTGVCIFGATEVRNFDKVR